jgi:hypothetical protein
MANVHALAATVEALKGSDKLRLAAALIDKGELATAQIIVTRVVEELALMKLLHQGQFK